MRKEEGSLGKGMWCRRETKSGRRKFGEGNILGNILGNMLSYHKSGRAVTTKVSYSVGQEHMFPIERRDT